MSRRRLPALALAALLALTLPAGADDDDDDDDDDERPRGGNTLRWRVAAFITTASAGPEAPFRAFLGQNLQWVDVDRDGRHEILATNTNQRIYLFEPTGRILSQVGWVAGANYDPQGAFQPGGVVGDLDGDGLTELHFVSNTGHMRAYEYAGPGTTGVELVQQWERCLLCWTGELDGTPWGAQGKVFVQHDGQPRQWALSAASGATLWAFDDFDGNAGVVARDLDGDGTLEVVFATDLGVVGARAAHDGTLRWVFNAQQRLGVWPGSVPGQPTVHDLDGDGTLEVAVSARDAHSPDPRQDHAVYFLLDHAGNLRWSASLRNGNPMALMHPVPIDVNRDGMKDLLWLDWNTLGHQPGDFSRLGPANLFALDGRNGRVLWTRTVDAWWSAVDLAVADADGDRRQEILVPQRSGSRDGVGLYTLDGKPDGWWAAPRGWTLARGVLAVELDGRLHLVLSLTKPTLREGVQEPAGSGTEGALLLVDTRARYDAAWPGQYTFTT